MGSRCHSCGPRGPSRALCDAEALLCNTADMTVSCAVEDSIHRAEMPARTTSETAACAREETEAYVRAELPSESPDRTSNRVNDHDAVDGSRLSTQPSCEGKEAVGDTVSPSLSPENTR